MRGTAVAVVGAGVEPAAGIRPSLALHSPIVLACSRAAWGLGVRLGMTASAARFVSPELRVIAADAQLERETVRAIADALLGVSAVVDTGGRVASGAHLAMYCQVPAKARGAAFGERLLELVDVFGLTARIGIADDRFTAWVAAAHASEVAASDSASVGREAVKDGRRVGRSARLGAGDGAVGSSGPSRSGGDGSEAVRSGSACGAEPASPASEQWQSVRVAQQRTGRRKPVESRPAGAAADERGVVCVPRGGSAAFLAPRPLSLLAITPEVQHMLEALGVRTLGEFAALPAPSVARPLEADYQALARGDSGSALRPYAPEAPIREELVAGQAGELFGGASAVATLARRVALRLAGRARGASRLEVTILGEGALSRGIDRAVPVAAARAASSERALCDLIAPVVGASQRASTRIRVEVVGEAMTSASEPRGNTARPEVPAEAASDQTGGALRGAAGEVTDGERGDAASRVAGVGPVLVDEGERGALDGDVETDGEVEAEGEGEMDGEVEVDGEGDAASGAAGEAAPEAVIAAAVDGSIDALVAALSSRLGREHVQLAEPAGPWETGREPWRLAAAQAQAQRAERRTAHRRTRRARPRRSRQTPTRQLFGGGDGQ